MVLSSSADPPTEQVPLSRGSRDSLNTYRIEAYTRGVSLPPGAVALVVTRGPNEGSRFVLGSELVTIGRRPSSAIILDDISVSRDHAEIRSWEDIRAVVDCGSLNGIYVNSEQVEEARLHHGDQLQIGVFKLVYLTEGAS
jgi:pSer/pThr/pTyr-binding forkhead associated (FHA) protein